jgi:hypothetical protein
MLEVAMAQHDPLLRVSCSVSLHVNLNAKKSSNFFVSTAVGASYQQSFKPGGLSWLQPSAQLTANFYQGTVGTNIWPEDPSARQFELVFNTALTTRLTKDSYFGEKPVRTFCNFNAVAISHTYKNSLTLATNFVLNPRYPNRNQQVGFGGVSTGDFALGYYNDGTPWNFIGLGDGADRWWTGGGYFEVWTMDAPVRLGLYYDNFTGGESAGRTTKAFEFANVLGLAHVDFKDKSLQYFNRGQIMVRAALRNGLGVSAILSGDKYMFFQNFIHKSMDQSLYPSYASERFHLGVFFDKPYNWFKP